MDEPNKNTISKLVELSRRIGFLEFDSVNTHQRYGYASAASIIRRINKDAADLNLLFTSREEVLESQIIYLDGKPPKHLVVTRLTLTCHDGDASHKPEEAISSEGIGSGIDSGDKAAMKASTAAFKYALAHMLLLGWASEDPEADEGTDRDSNVTTPKKKSTGSKSSSKVSSSDVDVDALVKAITEAKSEDELKAHNKTLLALKSADAKEFRRVRNLQKERLEALQGER